jgi:hypothetical protein
MPPIGVPEGGSQPKPFEFRQLPILLCGAISIGIRRAAIGRPALKGGVGLPGPHKPDSIAFEETDL